MIISIVFPSRGTVDPAFAVALRVLQIPLTKEEDRFEVLYVSGADVAVARNTLALDFKGDYIFFIDDDVLPPMDTLVKLLKHDKDIVAGLYFAKQRPHFPQMFRKSKKAKGRYDSIIEYPKDDLLEIDACGAGCMLIKKEVFDKLKKPFFQYIPRGENTPRMGEDFYFCEKAKKAGFKIYCDTSIVCKHIGTTYIGPEHWQISLDKLKEIERQLGPKKFEKYKQQMIELADKKQG